MKTPASGNLVNVVIPPLPQAFTYEVPASLVNQIDVGFEVEVPFGRRQATGYLIKKLPADHPRPTDFALKKITSSKRKHPLFRAEQLQFFEWVANYYGDCLANVLDVAVPPLVPQKYRRSVRAISGPQELKGRVERQLLEFLQASSQPQDYAMLLSRFKGAGPALKRLKEKKLIEIDESEIIDQHILQTSAPEWAKSDLTLNAEQKVAAEQIIATTNQSTFTPFLLHGVTGSGKTEVYIECIRHVLAQGKGALVIVPEIALTPQLIDRFQARLGSDLGILHSALQPRARWDAWRALLEGRTKLGIGARSAIFAPVQDLGLIIVDEEHDTSYKQAEGLRYNARDIAIARAKFAGCPVVLGSATPSLETFHNARSEKYTLLSLPSRPQGSTQASIEVVDLNRLKPWEMKSKNISPLLHQQLEETLQRKEQAFILYNRRGFARYLQCERCEYSLECPNCSVTLTFHQSNNALQCHYCGMNTVPPRHCPRCASTDAKGEEAKPGQLVQRGAGTERVFEELQELFPEATFDRLDRDAASDPETYRRILDHVRSGQTQVLVGTQMIAKGHDLPGVTLVGVVDCDIGLHMPDFRAGERVFHLLTQAAGRAGRGTQPGTVILQTRVPKHASLIYTLSHNFVGFADQELANRRMLSYPPFTRILRIVASSTVQELPLLVLEHFQKIVADNPQLTSHEFTLLGPCPAPLERLKAQWRAHLLIKSRSATTLHKIMQMLAPERNRDSRAKVIFDIDPQEML